jgi:hypothetical protein
MAFLANFDDVLLVDAFDCHLIALRVIASVDFSEGSSAQLHL